MASRQNPFGKGKDSLPPPFGSKNNQNDNEDIRGPGGNVEIGTSDKDPSFGGKANIESGGMIVGPQHPIFDAPNPNQGDANDALLPKGAVPPGARFDPISPVGPRRDPHGDFVYPSGEPDPDELPPPGRSSNPVNPGWKPPSTNRGPFGGGGPPNFL